MTPSEFTLERIVELGLLRKKKGLIKVLNNGELSTAVTIHAHKFSATAKEAIEKAGGQAILIGEKTTPYNRKAAAAAAAKALAHFDIHFCMVKGTALAVSIFPEN